LEKFQKLNFVFMPLTKFHTQRFFFEYTKEKNVFFTADRRLLDTAMSPQASSSENTIRRKTETPNCGTASSRN